MLKDYAGAGGEVTVPGEWEGEAVTALGSGLYYGNAEITSLAVPAGVEAIGDSAIYWMEKLETAVLPEGLQVIGCYNFYNMQALTEVTIPASVQLIDHHCFNDCGSLQKITFLGEAPVIGADCFTWLSDGAVVLVPDDCLAEYQALLGNSVTVEASGQNAIPFEAAVSEEGYAIDENGVITACPPAGNVLNVPASIGGVAVKEIGEGALAMNHPAMLVRLPEGLERIGKSVFRNCGSLIRVELPSTLREIGEDAFGYFMGSSLDFPEGLAVIGKEAFRGSKLTGTLELPDSLETIGESAFQKALNLSAVYFGEGIRSIGENAFAETRINYLLFNGLELPEIAPTAFAGAPLADVDLHTRATKQQMLDLQAFLEENGQESVRVWRNQNPDVDYCRDGLSTYENGLMTGYTGAMTHIRPWDTFDEMTTTGIAAGALKDNQVVRYFAVCYNDAFVTVGAEAFADSVVETVDLFDSVTTIGEGAFRNCMNLKNLVIPDSVTEIGAEAFAGCTGLSELTLPAGLVSAGENLFAGCENLEKVTVLCDLAALPDQAFAGCEALLAHPERIVLQEDAAEAARMRLSAGMGLPWYAGLLPEGQTPREIAAMPFSPTDPALFEFDPETGAITGYTGREADVVVPREINGVAVREIGYNAFEACRDYTYTEIVSNRTSWVHLRSVVLPETVEVIADSAFSYCQDLESFICYGPVRSTGRGTFSLCRSLREVIFVNGLYLADNYLFDESYGLEALYSPDGPYEVGEGFEMPKVVEEVPDVEAILAAYAADPYEQPEPEPEPEPLEAKPVGEAGEPYLGAWKAVEVKIGGESYPTADFGMDGMIFVLNADGTVTSVEDGERESMAWMVDENGVAHLETMTAVLGEDGRLVMEEGEEDILLIFERTDEMPAAPAEAPAETPAEESEPAGEAEPETEAAGEAEPEAPAEEELSAEDPAHYVGTWHGVYIEAGPNKGNPQELWGLDIVLTLNADGSGDLDYGGSDGGKPWGWDDEAEQMYYGEETADELPMPLFLLPGGFLRYGTVYSGYIVFSQDPEASWDPVDEQDPMPASAGVELTEAAAPAAAEPALERSTYVGRKFVCTRAEAGGVTISPENLGGEYSILFRESGEAAFVVAGSELPQLSWESDGEDFVMDYYGQAELRFVPSGEQLLLNYMGAMNLTFEAE